MLTGHRGFVTLVKQLGRGIVETQRAVEDSVAEPSSSTSRPRLILPAAQAYRARGFRQRAWLFYDLLLGCVGRDHPLHGYLSENGFADEDFAYFGSIRPSPTFSGLITIRI